jgi:hypothetical protein
VSSTRTPRLTESSWGCERLAFEALVIGLEGARGASLPIWQCIGYKIGYKEEYWGHLSVYAVCTYDRMFE